MFFQISEVRKGAIFQARSILFATGSEYRKLPLAEAAKFEHKGVHYCALCDGFAYKGKIVAVVGGGDGALKEAIELSQLAKKVYLIARGEQLKGEAVNVQKVQENSKIEVILSANIVKIIGGDQVEAVELDCQYQNNHQISVNGIFVSIGHMPNSILAEKIGIKLDIKKQIMINKYGETNLPGIFAAGDVCNTDFKQLITGCAEAVSSAYKAFEFIKV